MELYPKHHFNGGSGELSLERAVRGRHCLAAIVQQASKLLSPGSGISGWFSPHAGRSPRRRCLSGWAPASLSACSECGGENSTSLSGHFLVKVHSRWRQDLMVSPLWLKTYLGGGLRAVGRHIFFMGTLSFRHRSP